MSEFDINSLLNGQSAPAASPAGPRMTISMLPRESIVKNPENRIYVIGDVSLLREDIAANGIRQPLEVIPAADGKYLLIGGERRLTACDELAAQGDRRFDRLPCIIRASQGAAEDRIALITANATARELTDGERLDQYEALKASLEQLKAEGKLDGRVREEMSRLLGESSGSLGRLGAISANCSDAVKKLIREGKCGFTRAYEASRLPRRVQACYIADGTVPEIPALWPDEYAAVVNWLVNDALADALARVDWRLGPEYFLQNQSIVGLSGKELDAGGCAIRILHDGNPKYCTAYVQNPDDDRDTFRKTVVRFQDLYPAAKRKYQSADDAAREAREHAEWKNTEAARAQKHANCCNLARTELNNFLAWPVDMDLPQYGLTIYRYTLPDEWKIYAMRDANSDPQLGPRARYQMRDPSGAVHDGRYDSGAWNTWVSDEIVERLASFIGENAVQNVEKAMADTSSDKLPQPCERCICPSCVHVDCTDKGDCERARRNWSANERSNECLNEDGDCPGYEPRDDMREEESHDL